MFEWKILNPGLTNENIVGEDREILIKDQNAVMQDVLYAVQEFIPFDPPLGYRPIEIYQKEGQPFTHHVSGNDPYRIGLSATDRFYFRMMFQFAHEVGHIYFGPTPSKSKEERVKTEVFCELLSRYVLARLAKKWKTEPPYCNWQKHGEDIQKYLDGCLPIDKKFFNNLQYLRSP